MLAGICWWAGRLGHVAKRPGSRAHFPPIFFLARHAQAGGKVVPGQNCQPGAANWASRLLATDPPDPVPKSTGGRVFSQMMRLLRRSGPCCWRLIALSPPGQALRILSTPLPGAEFLQSRWLWAPLSRNLGGLPEGSGIPIIPGCPESGLPVFSGIKRDSTPSPTRRASAALACKRPLPALASAAIWKIYEIARKSRPPVDLGTDCRWIGAPSPIESARLTVLAGHRPFPRIERGTART